MGSFSIWHWLIVLVIVVLVFGTKKLKNIGSDLGGAVKGFKDGVKDGSTSADAAAANQQVTHQQGHRPEHRRRRSQDQVVIDRHAPAPGAFRQRPRGLAGARTFLTLLHDRLRLRQDRAHRRRGASSSSAPKSCRAWPAPWATCSARRSATWPT